MRVYLTPSFELSNEYAGSCDEAPLLVNRHTGERYVSTDNLTAYSSWGAVSATSAVVRMAHGKELGREERAFIARFTG
jgi:hypothetical protein